MIDKINLEDILFLDIETVSQFESWSDVPEITKELFELKTTYQRKNEFTAEEFYSKAAIWAEFGKIICISVGYFVKRNDTKELRITSFFNDDEYKLLLAFKELLKDHFYKEKHVLCAHNGKEFDFPYIARRMIIHQIKLPKKLNLFGK